MLFFKKKEKEAPSNEKKAAKAMPRTKKVQFLPTIKISELTNLLNSDIYEITKLEPVNYYADKSSYYQCTFVYQEDYSEVYFTVEQYDNDFLRASPPYYKADYELMKKTVIKFGQRI